MVNGKAKLCGSTSLGRRLTAALPFNTQWIPSLQLTIGIGDEVRSQNAFLDDMVRAIHTGCMGVT
jgi:hypothetical protein